MAYLCNYDVISLKGRKTKFRTKACFSGTYTSIGCGTHKGIHIYVLKDYHIGNFYNKESYDTNDMIFTEDEIFKYSRALMELGFNFTMEHDAEVSFEPKIYEDKITKPCYKFMIPFEENCHHANLILVNLIRFIHEDHFPEMVRWFLDNLDEKNDKVPILDRLMMATSSSEHYFNEGHTFAKLYRPIDITDHKKLHNNIFSNPAEHTHTNIISGKYQKGIYTMLQDPKLTLTEKHEKYKKL